MVPGILPIQIGDFDAGPKSVPNTQLIMTSTDVTVKLGKSQYVSRRQLLQKLSPPPPTSLPP